MAQAQNKLGELFVDLGVNGTGKMLKSLNSVSATLLMTTNAAKTLAKPIINAGKEALNSAVSFGKLSAKLGITEVEAEKLRFYFKQKNLDEGLVTDISSMMDKMTRIKTGLEGLPAEMAYTFNALGIEWQKYSNDFEGTTQMFEDIFKKITKLSPAQQRLHLQNMGMSEEWLYALKRGDFNLKEGYRTVPAKDVQNVIRARETANKAAIALELAKLKATSSLYEHGGDKVLNAILDLINKGLDYANPPETPKPTSNNKLTPLTETEINNPSGNNPVILPPPPIDTSKKSMLQTTIEINNNNTINGNNAEEIANKIAAISVQDIQMAQYQAHNMAGV